MKTYNQFLNTPFSEEIKPPEPQEEDPSIKSKEKRQMQIKKQVLLKKMQAVRAGAGADIVASHTPEGEMVEAKVDAGKSPETKEKDRNVRKFGVSHNVAGHGKLRRSLHKMNRGDKKIKGDKSQYVETESVQYEDYGKENFTPHKMIDPSSKKVYMADTYEKHMKYKKMGYVHEEKNCGCGQTPCKTYGKKKVKVKEGTDKAFEYVKKQIAAKYGKSGYVSKDNPRKPQSAADKAKVRAHQAKVDKENAAERAKDPSQGRYPKG